MKLHDKLVLFHHYIDQSNLHILEVKKWPGSEGKREGEQRVDSDVTYLVGWRAGGALGFVILKRISAEYSLSLLTSLLCSHRFPHPSYLQVYSRHKLQRISQKTTEIDSVPGEIWLEAQQTAATLC